MGVGCGHRTKAATKCSTLIFNMLLSVRGGYDCVQRVPPMRGDAYVLYDAFQ